MDRKHLAALLPLLSFILFLSSCGEQPILTGKVLDEAAKPVQGARVLISGSQLSTETDADGNFSLKYIPGNFQLEVSNEGYSRYQFDLSLTTPSNYPLETVYLFRMPEEGSPILFTTNERAISKPGAIQELKLSSVGPDGSLKQENFTLQKLTVVSGPVVESRKIVDLFGAVFHGRTSVQLAAVNDQGLVSEERLKFQEKFTKSISSFQIDDGREVATVFLMESVPPEGLYAFYEGGRYFSEEKSPHLIRFFGQGDQREIAESKLDSVASLIAVLRESASRAEANKDWSQAIAHLGDVTLLSKDRAQTDLEMLELFKTAMTDLVNPWKENQIMELAKIAQHFEPTQVWAELALQANKVLEVDNAYQASRSRGSLSQLGAPNKFQVMEGYLARGKLYYLLAEPEKAAADFRRAMEVNPDHRESVLEVSWRFAADPNPDFRDPEFAISLVLESDYAKTDGRYLEAVAAAQSVRGRMDLAESYQLLAMVSRRSPSEPIDAIVRSEMYDRKLPFTTGSTEFELTQARIIENSPAKIANAAQILLGSWRSAIGVITYRQDRSFTVIQDRHGYRIDGHYELDPDGVIRYDVTHKEGKSVPAHTVEEKLLLLADDHFVIREKGDDETLLATKVKRMFPDLSEDHLLGHWVHSDEWHDGTDAVLVFQDQRSGQVRGLDKSKQNEAMQWELFGDVFQMQLVKYYQSFRVISMGEDVIRLRKLNHSNREYVFRKQRQ